MQHVRTTRGGFVRLALSLAVTAACADTQAADAVRVPQLTAPASVAYDAEGVALIRAGNEYDMAFLQGAAHARDRFFQMDVSRRTASGTLAEILGPDELASDVQFRTFGLRRAAWATWHAADDDTRRWIKAYTNGVNWWLRTSRTLPPEYAALEITQVEPWQPVDSIVAAKLLTMQLSFDFDVSQTVDLAAYQAAGEAHGFDGSVLFFGDTHRFAPPDDRVTIPGALDALATRKSDGGAGVPRVQSATAGLARAYRDTIAQTPRLATHLKPRAGRGGSNIWVVSGALTQSGKPILSNDPHLGLPTPAVFIEQHLVSESPSINVVGVSMPGVPGVLQGCSDRVCWGSTTNPLDVTDMFQETLKLDAAGLPTAIVHDGVEEPVERVYQSYYVNNIGDGRSDNLARDTSALTAKAGVTTLVPRRNRGPIVQIDGEAGLSIAYTGWGPTSEIEGFRRMGRARNRAEFEDAISFFDVGSQNFTYADVDGNIAYFTSAEAPLRTDLQTHGEPGGGVPPWLVRDGSGALGHDWLPLVRWQPNQSVPYEVLPAAEMPKIANPESGYIANANNDPVGTTLDNDPLNQTRAGGGAYYLAPRYSPYRMGRIDRVLEEYRASGRKITPADMQALQADHRQLDAELVAPHLVAALDRARAPGAWAPLAALANDAKIAEAIERIRAWDYSTPTGIREGYDPGDNPQALPEPDQAQIDASVAASLFAIWRSQAIRNTVDATLTKVGLADALPDGESAYASLKFLLDNHDVLGGKSLSGLDFFVPLDTAGAAPAAADARDYLLLASMRDGLALFASDAFKPAFGNSTNLADYRWGKLHRIVFAHKLGGAFDLPGSNGYGFADLSPELPGVARSGGFEVPDESSHEPRASSLNDFMFASGPARRFVAEMQPKIVAAQIIPGGQSGVPGSPLYASQLGRWLTNGYHTLAIDRSDAAAAATSVTHYVP
jgi:penicillin amidase